jgi:hypothetical protein
MGSRLLLNSLLVKLLEPTVLIPWGKTPLVVSVFFGLAERAELASTDNTAVAFSRLIQ